MQTLTIAELQTELELAELKLEDLLDNGPSDWRNATLELRNKQKNELQELTARAGAEIQALHRKHQAAKLALVSHHNQQVAALKSECAAERNRHKEQVQDARVRIHNITKAIDHLHKRGTLP